VPLFSFFLVNLVPAPVGARLRIQAETTLVGILPRMFVLSLAGTKLGMVIANREAIDTCAAFSPEFLAALAGMVLLSLPRAQIQWRLVTQAPLSPS